MNLIRKILPLFLILSFVAITDIQANEYTAAAKVRLDHSFNIILNLIETPGFTSTKDRPATLKKIEDEVKQLFDFKEFSSRAAGPAWKKFTQAQRDEFTSAFANLLIYTYLSKIKNYNGERIAYTRTRSSTSGEFVEIGTTIDLDNGQKIPVAYRMLAKNNSWFVYDVIVERISLVKNFRTQFHDILSNKSADELIVLIKNKAKEVKNAQE